MSQSCCNEHCGEDDSYRGITFLPNELGNICFPLHYDVHLFLPELDSNDSTFEGYVSITICLLQDTQKIALHADPKFINTRGAIIQVDQQCYQISPTNTRTGLGIEGHVIEFNLPNIFKADTLLNILIVYEGLINGSPQGLYQTCSILPSDQLKEYFDRILLLESSNDGNDVALLQSERTAVIRTIASSLEPLFSRRLFPCFDSLNLKATFAVAVSYPVSNDEALENQKPPIKVISSTSPILTGCAEYPPLFPSIRCCLPNIETWKDIGSLRSGKPSTLVFSGSMLARKRNWMKDSCNTCYKTCVRDESLLLSESETKPRRRKLQRRESSVRSIETLPTQTTASSIKNFDSQPEAAIQEIGLTPQRFGLTPTLLSLLFKPDQSSQIDKLSSQQQLTLDTIPRLANGVIATQQAINNVNETFIPVEPEICAICDNNSSNGFQIARVGKAPNVRLGSIPRNNSTNDLIDHGSNNNLWASAPANLETTSQQYESSKHLVNEDQLPAKTEKRKYQTTLFETTPVLPCYALEIALGHFREYSPLCINPKNQLTVASDFSKTHTSFPFVEIRTQLVPPYKFSSSDYSLYIARKCLDVFRHHWYNVPYPLTKLDLVPLPNHRGLGLENFGCITFDDRYFFVDWDVHRHHVLRVSRLVCHEIAHMWFGDLVTPPSFDELWLKEGFVRFIEYCVLLDIFNEANYNNTYASPGLSELLDHFKFNQNDIWGSFLLEVFWDSLVADSQQLGMITPTACHSSRQLRKVVKIYERGESVLRLMPMIQSHHGKVTKTGFRLFDKVIRQLSTNKNSKKKMKGDVLHVEQIHFRNSIKSTPLSRSEELENFASTSENENGHPIELKGLLKTHDIMEKFNSITYGKAACILNMICEFIGGSKVFFRVLHTILQKGLGNDLCKVPMSHLKQQEYAVKKTIFTKNDLWESISAIFMEDDFMKNPKLFFIEEPKIFTASLVEALFDPWLTTEGFPRISIDMTKAQVSTKPSFSFTITLTIQQIMESSIGHTNEIPEPTEHGKSNSFAVSNNKKKNPLTVPLFLTIDNKNYGLLLQDTPTRIRIQRNLNEAIEGGCGVKIKINPNAGTFCTIHPQNDLVWGALINSIKDDSSDFNDREVLILFITIIEDARFKLRSAKKSTSFERRRGPPKLLKATLKLLYDFYCALCVRLSRKIETRSPTTNLHIPFPILSVLHLTLTALDWVTRAVLRSPRSNRENLEIISLCEKWMATAYCPYYVYEVCQHSIETVASEVTITRLQSNCQMLDTITANGTCSFSDTSKQGETAINGVVGIPDIQTTKGLNRGKNKEVSPDGMEPTSIQQHLPSVPNNKHPMGNNCSVDKTASHLTRNHITSNGKTETDFPFASSSLMISGYRLLNALKILGAANSTSLQRVRSLIGMLIEFDT